MEQATVYALRDRRRRIETDMRVQEEDRLAMPAIKSSMRVPLTMMVDVVASPAALIEAPWTSPALIACRARRHAMR
jgi:hypothetical protein